MLFLSVWIDFVGLNLGSFSLMGPAASRFRFRGFYKGSGAVIDGICDSVMVVGQRR